MTEAAQNDYIDLLTLQNELQDGIASVFPDKLWVKAEISSVQVRTNGHCYLELCQNEGGATVAKARAVIWRSKYGLLSAAFREAAGSGLQEGMSVLLRVQVTYSELYGLTLNVDDIDAEVTLGAKELERQKTIAKLKEDGLMDRQAGLELPLLPYSLAVISAPDAAGYGDFHRHLLENEYGFVFDVDLFEATMQGSGAPESVTDALEEIQTCGKGYDAVLILRGGGSNLDLSCFDDYGMCLAIAQCDIPVFTAIGHDRDYHVADMVAHSFVKTPTALADVFLDCYASEDQRISSFGQRLRLAFNSKLSAMLSRVELLSSRILSADPRNILARGFALAVDSRGVVMKNASGIDPGDDIKVMFSDAELDCRVTAKKQRNGKV
ncbi:MAG: exodeoxyribonuclease VII large subunit [Bacteroidales bacterium]|nr:exodeoxyribonuclease VII large subunit [Bacteroidales bacterium]